MIPQHREEPLYQRELFRLAISVESIFQDRRRVFLKPIEYREYSWGSVRITRIIEANTVFSWNLRLHSARNRTTLGFRIFFKNVSR